MKRTYFLVALLAILSAFFNPIAIAMLAGFLYSLDLKLKLDGRRYHSLCAITAWTLVKFPMMYYRFYYYDSYTSIALMTYLVSLAVYHLGEFLCTAYFHQDKVSWTSKI